MDVQWHDPCSFKQFGLWLFEEKRKTFCFAAARKAHQFSNFRIFEFWNYDRWLTHVLCATIMVHALSSSLTVPIRDSQQKSTMRDHGSTGI
jgi:hypothetical protein